MADISPLHSLVTHPYDYRTLILVASRDGASCPCRRGSKHGRVQVEKAGMPTLPIAKTPDPGQEAEGGQRHLSLPRLRLSVQPAPGTAPHVLNPSHLPIPGPSNPYVTNASSPARPKRFPSARPGCSPSVCCGRVQPVHPELVEGCQAAQARAIGSRAPKPVRPSTGSG